MFTNEQIEEIIEVLSTLDASTTKCYFGADSVRKRVKGKWYGRYATVFIIHMNGRHGCRLFSNISVEPDYDLKKDRPKMRMMTEVRKVCELYTQLIPFIDEFPIEVHLDISTDPKHGSSCAATEAAGYVLAMTGLPDESVLLKPHAFAASFGADRAAHLGKPSKNKNVKLTI